MSALEGLVVQRSTAAQQLAAGLASRIVAGAFAPGDRLRESAIATELGVARNTVREAVRILEQSGLVHYEVNRGAVVISPTPEKVNALYTAREVLETAAVARPAGESDLAALRTAYDELVEAAASRDALRIVDLDLAFHSAIVTTLGSTRLDEFYAELMVELRFYLTVLSLEDREFEHPDDILAEHRVILHAIEAGDTATAVQHVRSHIKTNARRVIEILNGRD
ncbi:GntR family transcriptional regulator [Promicromonospora panici]|uniref:GntR family transcriptional regulator n=1 Tax=Promicromonospora panici TaxID=2219658 RepID=UPI00101BE2AF|nr:GntR family transcriptional regulator [Promicromonospora panici]